MYRFILLYIDHDDGRQYFAEGLIHVDRSVYIRGFYPEEGKLYGDLYALKCAMRDNEDIRSFHIQMIDEIPVQVNGI